VNSLDRRTQKKHQKEIQPDAISSGNEPEANKFTDSQSQEKLTEYNNAESQRILSKWRNGVIICPVYQLFTENEADIRLT
jgi:hypothetical protein